MRMSARSGFSILELLLAVVILGVLGSIVLFMLNAPQRFLETRNSLRRSHVAALADAISRYTEEEGRTLFLSLPLAPQAPVEICGDLLTGSCTGLLNLSPLLPEYLDAVPMDPQAESIPDEDSPKEHTRYFIFRHAANRFTLFASDTEPAGSTDIEVQR